MKYLNDHYITFLIRVSINQVGMNSSIYIYEVISLK